MSGSWLCWAWTHQRQIRLSPERIRVPSCSPQTEGRIAQRLLVFLEVVEERRPDLPNPWLRRLRPRQRELPHSQKVNHRVKITRSVVTLPWIHLPACRCCLSIVQLFMQGSTAGAFDADLSQVAPRLELSAQKKMCSCFNIAMVRCGLGKIMKIDNIRSFYE